MNVKTERDRRRPIEVSFTTRELARIQAAAHRTGLAVASYIRTTVLANTPEETRRNGEHTPDQ